MKTFSGTLTADDGSQAQATVTMADSIPIPPDPGPDPGPDTGDGSANAPAGAPNAPTLLANYPKRPPWKLPGIDYRAGYPDGMTLKDPNTILKTIPGASGSNTNKVVTITGNDVEISGYDFSRNGGWGIEGITCNNPIIQKNYFKVGANRLVPISLLGWPNYDNGGGGAKILQNVIDGSGQQVGRAGIIFLSRHGDFIIQYNHIKESFEDTLDFSGANPAVASMTSSHDVRFNYLERCGVGPESQTHPDLVQTFATNRYGPINFGYNTFNQNGAIKTQGMVLQGNQNNPLATFKSGRLNNNLVILNSQPVGGMNFWAAVAAGQVEAEFIVEDNWCDPTTLNPISLFVRKDVGGSLRGTIIKRRNIDLRTGNLQPAFND